MDFLEEYDPDLLRGNTEDPFIDDVHQELACPFCHASSPTLALINGEYVADCCNSLLNTVEALDPDDEKHLLDITYSPLTALSQWKNCVRITNGTQEKRNASARASAPLC